MASKRNYVRERLTESKKRKEARKARGRARTKLGLKVGDPRTVEHKKPLRSGGTNAKSNLTTKSKSANSKANGGKGGRPRKTQQRHSTANSKSRVRRKA